MNKGLLFDTCALIKYLAGDLPESTKAKIIDCPGEYRYLSVATAWEITLKPGLRRAGLDATRVATAIKELRLQVLDVRLSDIWFLDGLPQVADHRDPFDRMIITHAYVFGLAVLTCDRVFSRYQNLQAVW